MTRVLVTGAGGFIGSNLGCTLADQNLEVIGLDLHFPERPHQVFPENFQKLTGDFRDPALTEKILSGVDTVFHLAGAHLQISLPESEYWDLNVHSLPRFLEQARERGVRRFVHTSTVGMYGNLKTWPADEEYLCRPQSIYGETKLAGEKAILSYVQATGFPVVILRPAWVYGPGCPRTRKIYRTLKKGRFVMIGPGDNLRHPLYIRDMIEAFRLAMDREEAVGQVLLVGGERPITTNELIETFCRVMNLPRPRIRIPYGWGMALARGAETVFGWLKMEPPLSRRSLEFFDTNNAFDIGRAKRVLGFQPRYTFEAGLEATREWLARA